MTRNHVLACVAVACSLLHDTAFGETISQADNEISHLLHYVDQSGCQFNRNGSWHDSHEASLHLQRKYQYLSNRHAVPDAESFIVRAAAQSSVSGRAYQVKCGGKPSIPSKDWLIAELARYRMQTKRTEKQ